MPTTTNYIWDEQNYLAESDGTNTINVVYTNEPQQYGNLVSTRKSGTTSYHQFDAVGSTRQLTTFVSHVTDTMIYDAWGNVLSRTGTTAANLLWIGVVGYYFDPETKHFFVRARVYDAAIGRWIAFDPAELLDDTNRLLYVYNSPVRLFDPSGRMTVKECTAALQGILADQSVQRIPSVKKATDCFANIFCSNGCGKGGQGDLTGQTFVAGGRVHICINAADLNSERELLAILIHEVIHAQQQYADDRGLCCKKAFAGPPPAIPDLKPPENLTPQEMQQLCDLCLRLESAAYDASCKFLYSKTNEINRCKASGRCFSCSHVCDNLTNPVTGKCDPMPINTSMPTAGFPVPQPTINPPSDD